MTDKIDSPTISQDLAEVAQVLTDVRRWLERAVIGLNLCPFAKAVHVKGQVHYAVYHLADDGGLMDALLFEAAQLVEHDAAVRDTTLLVAPHALADFLDFNDFVGRAERRLARAGFEGVLQLASFHPRYQFAGSEESDISNATNRSPHPILHLLREDSVSRAVDAFPEAADIFDRNIETLERLGTQGWAALDVGPHGASR